MSVQGEITTIFGGTGFIGRHIVRRLAKAGHTVKVATRVPERAYFLRPYGKVGQIVPVACDYSDAGIAAAVAGATNVINCVGILYEKRKSTFQKIHAELPGRIAAASREAGTKRLVHISALGVDQGTARYHESKLAGEEAVKKEFPPATILRPSIVFGAEDNFFNKFASIAAIAPALPLIGGGKTKFQPVFVGDVADAAMASLTSDAAKGKTYELGGPETVDFRQIYQRLFDCTQQPRMLISLPWGLAKFKATFLGLLPHPPLTTDQVESLKTDSVVHAGALSLHDLGIGPTGMSLILPEYLDYRRRGGAFAVQGHG
jgi:NADH dehydrogenase